MKKLFILAVLLSGLVLTQATGAQVNISINTGSQPQWGPSGYNYARYYYLPEINAYYDITRRSYIVQNGRRWVSMRRLPGRYRNFDLYRTYKIVMNTNSPWSNNAVHLRNYSRYRTDYTQATIRDYNNHHNNRHNDRRNDRANRDRRGNDRR